MRKSPAWLFSSIGLILTVSALLLIPATRQAIFGFLGTANRQPAPLTYNGFAAFIPFIPSYFPDDFEISYASTSSQASSGISSYSEIYASETHFFKTIQSQGPDSPELVPDPSFSIQGQPASLSNLFDLDKLMGGDLDLAQYDTQDSWLVSAVLKDIHIQVVTNLPKDEAIRVTEGLIPSICTSTPTPEG